MKEAPIIEEAVVEYEKLTIQNTKGEIESITSYDPERMSRLATKKNILIPQGSILVGGLVEIECVSPFLELVIPIGKDHTARLLISEEALYVLNRLEPDVTIY